MSVEEIKRASNHLRGTLGEELTTSDPFGADSSVVLKFHGIYQQDDRDNRRALAAKRLPLDHSCMVRVSTPGGRLSAEQWLALDRAAELADGNLRLTTRQGVQFHVVRKGELAAVVGRVNQALLTTIAACGDVVRNVMACPWPDERQAALQPLVAGLVSRFRPRSRSYWELWVDGKQAVSAEPGPLEPGRVERLDSPEPIYGDVYLPRKFKIAVGWPGDGCLDLLSNDVGVVPTLTDGTRGEVTGYMVFVGGGMGMGHAREEDTTPLLAEPLGWVPADQVLDVVEAVVTIHRDFGRRDDRQQARLKYVVRDRGIEWMRREVERRTGRDLGAPQELPPWHPEEHHGTVGDTIGLPIPSGKVADTPEVALRSALRQLTHEGLVPELAVTSRQDLILHGILPGRVGEVEAVLRSHGVALAEDVTALRRLAIACPALPTCGLALGEAERVLPDVVADLEKLLVETGNGDAPIRLNMTGCPNGCARPYTAEIGIVGRSKRTYDIYLGGAPGGDRLGQRLRADVPLADLGDVLRPVLEQYAATSDGQRFGDWAAGVGADAMVTWLPEPTRRRRGART